MRSPKPLHRVVAGDPLLAAWDARRRREAALACVIRAELPRQLGARVRVVDAQQRTLELMADSGAVAAAVRQRLPVLHERLLRDGHEFTGIRVRVQVRVAVEEPQKRNKNPLDREAVARLSQLARSLSPGPLKASLDRILKRSR
jgi:RNase P/RNase MRP subunit p29